MKNGKFAIYLGKEYAADKDDKMWLYSTDLEDISKGFKECIPFKRTGVEKEIVCTKIVEPSEVDAYYKVKTWAIYKGYKFEILKEEGDRLSILSYVGHYKYWEDLQMTVFDKGIYQKWIQKEEAKLEVEIEGKEDNDTMKAIWQLLNVETEYMKQGTFAVYAGKTYITAEEKGSITLYSAELEDISKGFELCEPFKILGMKKEMVCKKCVKLSNLDSYFKVRTTAQYKWNEVDIVEEKDNMLSIMGIETIIDFKREETDPLFKKERPYQKWIEKELLRRIRLEIKELASNQDIQSVWRLFHIAVKNRKEKKFAAYHQKTYVTDITLDGNFILYFTDLEDASKGFEECKPFQISGIEQNIVCIKYVNPAEIDSYFKIKILAIYQDYEFEVIEERGEMLFIATLYENGKMKERKIWQDMGMVPMDKYGDRHQKWIKKEEAEIRFEVEELLNNVRREG